jgi:hypothetical protein
MGYLISAESARKRMNEERRKQTLEMLLSPIQEKIIDAAEEGLCVATLDIDDKNVYAVTLALTEAGYRYSHIGSGCGYQIYSVHW